MGVTKKKVYVVECDLCGDSLSTAYSDRVGTLFDTKNEATKMATDSGWNVFHSALRCDIICPKCTFTHNDFWARKQQNEKASKNGLKSTLLSESIRHQQLKNTKEFWATSFSYAILKKVVQLKDSNKEKDKEMLKKLSERDVHAIEELRLGNYNAVTVGELCEVCVKIGITPQELIKYA